MEEKDSARKDTLSWARMSQNTLPDLLSKFHIADTVFQVKSRHFFQI